MARRGSCHWTFPTSCAAPARLPAPGLCANFARILAGETLSPDIAADAATSQVFDVIRGSGRTRAVRGKGTDLAWKKDDVVALPGGAAYHHKAGPDGAALYLVHDAPMLRHLGAAATASRFEPIVYPAEETLRVLARSPKAPKPPIAAESRYCSQIRIFRSSARSPR
jgi:hypothetical protein